MLAGLLTCCLVFEFMPELFFPLDFLKNVILFSKKGNFLCNNESSMTEQSVEYTHFDVAGNQWRFGNHRDEDDSEPACDRGKFYFYQWHLYYIMFLAVLVHVLYFYTFAKNITSILLWNFFKLHIF